MFVKQRRTHSWSSYLPGKKYIYPKGKIVKSLHHLCSMSVKTFLIMHLYTLQQHTFINALHKRVIGNLSRTNVCQTASNTQVKQLLARCTNWTTKKYYNTHCTTKNTQSFNFAWNFVCTKKQRKILLARGLSIQQVSALGRWNVTLLLLLLLRKKCEYHRTCCDYLVAAACQDFSAWNERKKLQHFHQLALNMVWDLWKSYARTFRCLALLRW